MKNTRAWIEAIRLRTLPVSVAGVLTAVGYSISDSCFKPLPACLCLVFAILCQIASNFANEYFDYRAGRDRAGREGPRRGVTEGDITPRQMLTATIMVLCTASLIGLSLIYWGGMWLIWVGIAIAIGAIAYSAGPFALSTHCLGEAGVIFFFGLVPVNFTYYVQSLQWTTPVLLGSIAIGLIGANVLIVNNYRDIADDRAVGKHTLANTLPAGAMPILYCINGLAACALVASQWYQLGTLWLAVPILFAIIYSIIAFRMPRISGHALTPLLGITAMSMLLYSLLFIAANIIAHGTFS